MNQPSSAGQPAAILATLRSSTLFKGLPEADLRALSDMVVLKTLESGDYLFHEGARSHGFYIIHRGAINVHRVTPAGKEQIIHIFRSGESFAEAALAMDTGYPADARAAENSSVLLVQKAGFIALIRKQPEFALRMLASMSLHLRLLVGQLEDLTLKDVETRLANWLLKQCPNRESSSPAKVHLATTKRLVAAELGTVSETFSRSLAKLRDHGLITIDGRIITVQSPAELLALVRKNIGE